MKDRGRDTVAFRYRSALRLLTLANHKTPKGEDLGYLSAILYLVPHTSGGGRSVCPHSTPSCRAMCLGEAGLASLPKQIGARMARTDLWHNAREAFMEGVELDIEKFLGICRREAMTPTLRLNGSSDILWERHMPDLLARYPQVQFYDYTKVPLESRTPPANYHLTYSVGAAQDWPRAIAYLRAGHSVAVVTTVEMKSRLVGLEVAVGSATALFVDGDEHDLRFLDPPGSVVLLKPKGIVRTDLVRLDPLREIRTTAAGVAA